MSTLGVIVGASAGCLAVGAVWLAVPFARTLVWLIRMDVRDERHDRAVAAEWNRPSTGAAAPVEGGKSA